MLKFSCPICENRIELPEDVRPGYRFSCERCFAQLAVHKHRKKMFLGCPFCKEEVYDPGNCDLCERRHEKVKLYKDGV